MSAAEMRREAKSYEKWVEELGMSGLKKRRLRGMD